MKKDCSHCDHLGRDCPKKLMLLPLDEIIDWCLYIMIRYKITHEKIAQLSHVPKGTIDRVLSKQSEDCRYSTIHAIVCALFEFLGISSACLDEVASETVAQADEAKHQMVDYEKECQGLRTQVEELVLQREFLGKQISKKDSIIDDQSVTIRDQRRLLKITTVLLGLSAAIIFFALLMDRLNPHLGFIWRGVV